LYDFLTNPSPFDSYIACSAGFPGCEAYFMNLVKEMKSTHLDKNIIVFLTNGLKDSLDPDGKMNKTISDFSNLIGSAENITCEYITYENEGHVPYQSLYHGLKFIYRAQEDEEHKN
jgi:hypothetical protein